MGIFDNFFSGFGSSPQNNDTTFTPAADTNAFGGGLAANQSGAFHAPDPVGPSGNPFVNSFESAKSTPSFGSSDLGSGSKPAFGQSTKGEGFIQSYEASRDQQPQVAAYAANANSNGNTNGTQPGAGNAQTPNAGSQPAPDASPPRPNLAQPTPTAPPQSADQQKQQTPEERFPMRPDLGDSVKKYESGGTGVSTVSPGVLANGTPDPGGISYGTYQLSTARGTARDFAYSAEASSFPEL